MYSSMWWACLSCVLHIVQQCGMGQVHCITRQSAARASPSAAPPGCAACPSPRRPQTAPAPAAAQTSASDQTTGRTQVGGGGQAPRESMAGLCMGGTHAASLRPSSCWTAAVDSAHLLSAVPTPQPEALTSSCSTSLSDISMESFWGCTQDGCAIRRQRIKVGRTSQLPRHGEAAQPSKPGCVAPAGAQASSWVQRGAPAAAPALCGAPP